MTKAELITRITQQSGIEKTIVMTVVEAFMENVKESMVAGNDVFLRGFGSFVIKRRAKRVARNISGGMPFSMSIPHSVPLMAVACLMGSPLSGKTVAAAQTPNDHA